MPVSERPVAPSKYELLLVEQLEQCANDGIGCECCNNADACSKLFGRSKLFMNESDYNYYSDKLDKFRRTKVGLLKMAGV